MLQKHALKDNSLSLVMILVYRLNHRFLLSLVIVLSFDTLFDDIVLVTTWKCHFVLQVAFETILCKLLLYLLFVRIM